MRKKKPALLKVQTYTDCTYVCEGAGWDPTTDDVLSKMVEDPQGQWVKLEDWDTLNERIKTLEGSLKWCLNYGDFEDALDGNPIMKIALDEAHAALTPIKDGSGKSSAKSSGKARSALAAKEKP